LILAQLLKSAQDPYGLSHGGFHSLPGRTKLFHIIAFDSHAVSPEPPEWLMGENCSTGAELSDRSKVMRGKNPARLAGTPLEKEGILETSPPTLD
jgi:hypothetical protein